MMAMWLGMMGMMMGGNDEVEWRCFIRDGGDFASEIQRILSEQSFRENRTDVYLQCHSDDYGVKYRAGTRLEIKVRKRHDDSVGVESYVKYRLDDVADVFPVLRQHNVSVDESKVRAGSKITVKKSRVNLHADGDVVIEICHLLINDQQQFYSLAVEGRDRSVRRFLAADSSSSSANNTRLASLIRRIRDDTQTIVGGYPTFLHQVCD
jgi:hypothetical protein